MLALSVITDPSPADWWMVGIAGFAALVSASAAVASLLSARAARTTAEILKESHEQVVNERLRQPLMDLRDELINYSFVSQGEEGDPDNRSIQKTVGKMLNRQGLNKRLPLTRRFADAASNEIALGATALDELQATIDNIWDEGEAFRQ